MTIQKTAQTAVPINDLLSSRWSPRAFDVNYELADHELLSLLEAARWAPSSNNGQPWRFLAARRGEQLFDLLAEHLSGFNAAWAPNASALIVGLVQKHDANARPNRTAQYDLGLAIANLSVQATALGLSTHQMGGFDRDKLVETLTISDELAPFIMVAVGKPNSDQLSPEIAEREKAPRSRLDLSTIVLAGLPK